MPKSLLIDDKRDIKADVIARNFMEGIQALMYKGPFSILYLDHDLGDYDEFGKERTGYDIMCWLEQNVEYLPENIQCVSSNPVGRARILQVVNKLYTNHK